MLESKLNVMIKFGNKFYRRIMMTTKEFLLRAFVFQNIQPIQLECMQLHERIKYFIYDIIGIINKEIPDQSHQH